MDIPGPDNPELDNPFWSSLRSRHRAIARVDGDVARYPADFAPFLGVADASINAVAGLQKLVEPGESVFMLGIVPARIPGGWRLHGFPALAQMQCDTPLAVPAGPDAIELTAAHREDVLALTALVYPHYFRKRTMALGRYRGIYLDGRLAAIAGERLGTNETQEISAICTHPDFVGRGLARRLLALSTNAALASGRLAFLHVSHANPRALQLYARAGYRLRRDIGFWELQRPEHVDPGLDSR